MKKCSKCNTVWSDAWLDTHQDPCECPFCYTPWAGDKPPQGKAKRRPFTDIRKVKYLFHLENELEQIEGRLVNLETEYELGEDALKFKSEMDLQARNNQITKQIRDLQGRRVIVIARISELRGVREDKIKEFYNALD